MKKGELPVSSQGKRRQQKISSGENGRGQWTSYTPRSAQPARGANRAATLPKRNTSVNLREPPYTERYVRWCERTGARRPLLLDFDPEPAKPEILPRCALQDDRQNQVLHWRSGRQTKACHPEGCSTARRIRGVFSGIRNQILRRCSE